MTRGAGRTVALVGVGLLLSGCTAGSEPTSPAPQAAPPDPPAACLLDGAALTATTSLTWTPDQSTASDTRCVYDAPGGPAAGAGFISVDVTSSDADPAEQLDTIAELCEPGSRSPVDAGDGGFVCRFEGRQVYGALLRTGQLATIATSAVPAGTTSARLAVAFTEQLRQLGQ